MDEASNDRPRRVWFGLVEMELEWRPAEGGGCVRLSVCLPRSDDPAWYYWPLQDGAMSSDQLRDLHAVVTKVVADNIIGVVPIQTTLLGSP